MPRTNVTVVILLGIVALAGAIMFRMGIVSRPSAILTGLIWFAYMGYWAYEHHVATDEE